MKKSFLICAFTAFVSLAGTAFAGTLTVDPGTPVFTPPDAFTNNNITVEVISNPIGVTGDLVRISGAATVTPPDSPGAAIDISGTYNAEAGDQVSVAYAFTANLTGATPIDYDLSGTITIGPTVLPFQASGTIQPGLHQVTGTVAVPFNFIAPTSGTYTGELNFTQTGQLAPVGEPIGFLDLDIQQIDLQLAPEAASLPPPGQSLNISTRGGVQTGEGVLIAGFIITGNDPKQVVIRGLGPSLMNSNPPITGTLTDPMIELHDANMAIIATNDSWMDNSAADQTVITDNGLDLYNNQSISDSEAILVQTLAPGSYTVVLSGVNGDTGVGLVEVYDIDQATDSQLANLSTRGFVDTGDNALIGGFITGPGTDGASSIVVRAIGPSLADRGIMDPLADPTLEVHNSNGDVIASNDNWGDDPNSSTISDDGLDPDDPAESALLLIPSPDAYTAIVRSADTTGAEGSSGIALVEVYNLQ